VSMGIRSSAMMTRNARHELATRFVGMRVFCRPGENSWLEAVPLPSLFVFGLDLHCKADVGQQGEHICTTRLTLQSQ
jgi:hypothetical protein